MADGVLGFASRVAAALGGGWAAEPVHERGASLRHPDGRALFLFAPDYPWSKRGRVRVSGVYPQHQAWRRERAEVTVGMGRDPGAVARDLRRRLLPAYEAELAVAVAAEAGRVRDAAGVERVAAAVLAAVPGSREVAVGVPEGEARLDLRGHGYRHDVRVRSSVDGTEVDMDLRGVPAADAVRMLAALGAVPVAAEPGAVPAVVRPGSRLRRWLRAA